MFYGAFSLLRYMDSSPKQSITLRASMTSTLPLYLYENRKHVSTYHSVSVHIKIRWGVIGLISNNQANHINLNPIAIQSWCVCCCRSWASISDGATQVEGVFCQQIELETLYKLHSLSIPLLTPLKKMHMRP